jgi:hypothetical protein
MVYPGNVQLLLFELFHLPMADSRTLSTSGATSVCGT